MDTTLWAARAEGLLQTEQFAALRAMLPPERRERLDTMRFRAQQCEVLYAYALLLLALHRELGWTALPEVALSRYGKPWFPQWPQVQFSISHTQGAVMVGLSDAPIGVDVEKYRAVSPRLMERIGTQTEEDFLQRWVIMEACGKRDGRGVFRQWKTEAGEWTDPRIRAASRESAQTAPDGCRIVILFPGYAAAAAVSAGRGVPEPQIFHLDGLTMK